MEYVKAADMHCDTISMIQYRRGRGERIGLRENDMYIDLGKLKRAGMCCRPLPFLRIWRKRTH